MCFTVALMLSIILSDYFLPSGGGWYQQGNRTLLKFVHPNVLINQASRRIPFCNAVTAGKSVGPAAMQRGILMPSGCFPGSGCSHWLGHRAA